MAAGAGTTLPKKIRRNSSPNSERGGDDNNSSQQQQQHQAPSSWSSRFGRGGGGVSRTTGNNYGRLRSRRFLCSSIAIASLLCLVLMNLVYLHGRLEVIPSSLLSSSSSSAAVQHPAHFSNKRLRRTNFNTTMTQRTTTTRRRRQTEAAIITATAGRALASFFPEGIYENDILKRIHEDLQAKWKACAFQKQQQQQQQGGNHNYKRYGLLQVLDEYFAEHKNITNHTTTISNSNYESFQKSSSCVLPEASFTACNVTSMAMIAYTTITSTSNHHAYDRINHRRVLLSILQWLLDPHVKEIWLLVPVQQRPSFVNNSAYGQRLLLWEFNDNNIDNVSYRQQKEQFRTNNPGQQVFVVFCESLLQGVSIVEAESQEIAILWINANTDATTPNDVSTDTRNNLFQAWKQEASAIHVTLSTSLLLEWQGSNTTTSSSRLAVSSLSCPFQPSLSTLQGNTQERQQQQQQQWLPDLAGTMHHRSYLCFLRHPILTKSITAMSSSSPLKASSWSKLVYSTSALWLSMVASSSSSSSSTAIPGVVYWPVEHKDAPTAAKFQDEKRDHSLSDSAMWFYFGGPTEIMTRMTMMMTGDVKNTNQTVIQRRRHAQSSLCATGNVIETKQSGFFWN